MRKKTLIIGTIVIAVVALGIAALSLWPQTPAEPPDAELVQTQTSQTGDMLRVESGKYHRVVFTPADGISYEIVYDHATGPGYELVAENVIFPANQDLLNTVYNYAIRLSQLPCVTMEASDVQLTNFGFDEPLATWRIYYEDGSFTTVEVGKQQGAGSGYYTRLADSREVFLLGEARTEHMLLPLGELYDLTFFPYPPDDEDPPSEYITRLLLEKPDGEIIEVLKRPDDEALDFGASRYVLEQPYVQNCNDSAVRRIMLEPVTLINPTAVVAVQAPDLSPYGLDNPARLTVETDDWSGTLLIGNHDAALGGRYIMMEGYDAVLLDKSGEYPFLDVKADELRATLLWLHPISSVASIIFEFPDDTHTLLIEQDAEGSVIAGRLDDRELSESETKRLFTAALSVRVSGAADAAIPDAAPEYVITMNLNDGSSDKLELYRIADSQFLLVHNGVNTGTYITRAALHSALLGPFEALE